MKTRTAIKYFMVVATIGMLFTSCRKKEDEKDTDTSSASDNSLAEVTFNDVNNIADQASTGSLSTYLTPTTSDEKSIMSTCAVITNDTTVTPRLLTIDFGPTDCACGDGRDRRGKILVSYYGQYKDSASSHTITFDNYFVNNHQILGTKTVTNNGHNSSGNLTFSVVVNGQIVKPSGGGTITWNSTRTREWIQGELTPTWLDDIYLITGSANGTNSSGNSFTMTITSALRKEMAWRHIVSGQLTLTPSGKPTRYVDFGNGDWDNQATVTINGNVYNITLY